MRALIKVILVIAIFSSCDQISKKEIRETDNNGRAVKAEKSIIKQATDYQDNRINIGNLNQLIPIDTVNSISIDVFKKYGLEFNGNCDA